MNFQVETDTTFVDLNNPNIITLDVDSEEFKQIINEEFTERSEEEMKEDLLHIGYTFEPF